MDTLSKKILKYVDPDLKIRIIKSYFYNEIETAAELAGLEQSDVMVMVRAFNDWRKGKKITEDIWESYYEYNCQPGPEMYIWFDESDEDGYMPFNAQTWPDTDSNIEAVVVSAVESVLNRYFSKAR